MKITFVGLFVLLISDVQILTAHHLSVRQDTSDTVILDEVIIKENRISLLLTKTSRNYTLMDRKEMRSQSFQTLPEMLSCQPGVDIRQRGPAGVQADIGIRGGTFEQTLVLLNGMKMSDPQTGHHLLNLPFSYDDVEKVEIIKGPASSRYGQNAYAGAVNFITKVPDSNRLHFRSYGGDFNSWGGNISISRNTEKHAHYISFGVDASDGYQYNTDYKVMNGFYQGEYKAGKSSYFDLIAGISDRNFGANGFYASPQAKDQYEEVRTGIASLAYTYEGENWKIKPRVSWRNNEDNYSFIRDNPEVYQNIHTTNTYSFETNASFQNTIGTTGIGVELRKEEINGDWKRSGVSSKSNLHGFSRDNIGVFIEHKFSFNANKLDVRPGAYMAWYSDFETQFFPGVEAGYQIADAWRLYGNIGKSFRIPTFYDQYYESPREVGNSQLQPEKAWSYELGMRFFGRAVHAEANVFHRDNQNLIDWVLNSDAIWEARNFTKIKTKGLELLLSYKQLISTIGNNVAIENFTLSYNKIEQEQELNPELSRYALEHLSDQFIVSTGVRLYKNLKSSISYRYIKREEQQGYSLLDAKLYWKKSSYTIFAEVSNITETRYTEVMTMMPGRWYRMGLILDIPY